MKKVKKLKPIGHVHFGSVNEASIAYTLKYLQKPKTISKKNAKETGRQPEFSLMSKGLGSNYLTPQMVDWHKVETASRVYVTYDGNKKAGLPRYYKDKIYSSEDKEQINKQRCISESAKAAQVRDVFKFQRDFDQRKIVSNKKSLQKVKKGIL